MMGLVNTLAEYFVVIADVESAPWTLWHMLYNLVLYAILSTLGQYLVLYFST